MRLKKKNNFSPYHATNSLKWLAFVVKSNGKCFPCLQSCSKTNGCFCCNSALLLALSSSALAQMITRCSHWTGNVSMVRRGKKDTNIFIQSQAILQLSKIHYYLCGLESQDYTRVSDRMRFPPPISITAKRKVVKFRPRWHFLAGLPAGFRGWAARCRTLLCNRERPFSPVVEPFSSEYFEIHLVSWFDFHGPNFL